MNFFLQSAVYNVNSCDKFLDNLFAIMRCTYMRLVTSVCLYIYMLLVYERVLEKCFWGTGKSWKSPENFFHQKSGNPAQIALTVSQIALTVPQIATIVPQIARTVSNTRNSPNLRDGYGNLRELS